MKYFTLPQINEAIKSLVQVHPFFLITFLVAKKFDFPIGSTKSFALDGATEQFLRNYYKLHPKSEWLFNPYRGANRDKSWVKPNYASTGLQSINTRTFRDAFIHPPNSQLWGWSTTYLSVLKSKLSRGRISLFHLAVWINRNVPIPDSMSRADITDKFRRDFKLTPAEQSELFQSDIVSQISEDRAFQEVPVEWTEIISPFPMPPDVTTEAEAILTFISLQSLGPIAHLECHPATRLNLLTGDNGVGKTFFLDSVWWCLTNEWVDFPILPRPSSVFSETPSITYQIAGAIAHRPQTIFYNSEGGWQRLQDRSAIQSLVIYSRSDGAFAVWDHLRSSDEIGSNKIQLEREQVWFGKDRLIEGLLRDLVSWSSARDSSVFDLFMRNLARLSPPEMAKLTLGDPVRLPRFSQQIPTLRHAYGDVPIIFESAGIKRMVAMAYLIVWAWTEHRALGESLNRPTATKLVLLIDELEAHLHPKWQRTVLPALLGVLSDLSADLDSQLFVATHSPFVTASMESNFRNESDKFFTLDLQGNGTANFKELEFRPRGPVDSWLVSPAFGLKDARSLDSAAAISKAVSLQEQQNPSREEVKEAHAELVKLLPTSDRFWPRWLLFAKNHGVQL